MLEKFFYVLGYIMMLFSAFVCVTGIVGIIVAIVCKLFNMDFSWFYVFAWDGLIVLMIALGGIMYHE